MPVHSGDKLFLCLLQDVIFSFPVKCSGGKWEIVQGLKIDDFSAQKIKATGANAASPCPLPAMVASCLYAKSCSSNASKSQKTLP